MQPDKLAQSGKKATVEGMRDKRVLSDGTRTVELYHIQGQRARRRAHHGVSPEGEAPGGSRCLYAGGAQCHHRRRSPIRFSVNLYDNIERLKLAVDQILPLHGRMVPLAELQKAIGKSS